MPPAESGPDVIDESIGVALATLVGRRRFVTTAAGGLASLITAACAPGGRGAANPTIPSQPTPLEPAATVGASPTTHPSPTVVPASTPTIAPSPSPVPASPTAVPKPSATESAAGQPLWAYAFNVGSLDVTIVDTQTNNVVATRPLGAAVRWLSNEQRYWDGSLIWTYDYPQNKLEAIGIDPSTVKVSRRIPTGSQGPAYSLMLTTDNRTAMLDAASDDVIDVVDLKSGQVTDRIKTGAYP